MVGELRPMTEVPPNPSFLRLTGDEEKFYKLWTGINDDEELRRYIMDVATRAYNTYKYPCISSFTFIESKILRVPDYNRIIKLGQERPGAILLDFGCCVGHALRRAVIDGWPDENAIGFDLEPAFWEYGHQLFKTNSKPFRAGFVAGNAFDPKTIKPRGPFYKPPNTPRPQDLRILESLTPLQGHVSVIYVSNVFHLFDGDEQKILAKRLASLLSPEPGSVICGCHRGAPVKTITGDMAGLVMVCHSPESWRELWDGQVFEKGRVSVEAVIDEAGLHGVKYDQLNWSITRL